MNQAITDIITGPDGKSVEIAHLLWIIGVIALVGMAIYTAIHTGAYPANFGQDFGFVNAGGAAGAWGRAKADQAGGS